MNAKLKHLLQDYEKEILEAWHTAQGNKNIPFKVTLTQAGLCAERICQATYIRKKGEEPSSKITFFKMTLLFYKEGLFDIQMKTMMNALRQSAAERRHKSTTIEKAFVDNMRLFLIDIIIWYQKTYKIKFQNLQLSKYQSWLYIKPTYTQVKLWRSGHVSDKNFERNMQDERFIHSNIEQKKLLRTPVYASLLIDVSGSMHEHTNDVILGHKEALSAIRGSLICKQKSLFLMQHLFNHESQLLNSLTRVDKSGNDAIIVLDKNNYRPHSTTALFDTLYEAINMICIEVNSLKVTRGKKPEIVIGVMTDGADTQSKSYNSKDIKKLMEYLEKENVIKSSVLFGWTSRQDLSIKYLEELKTKIGFKEAIALNQSEPKAIRDAFNLFSQRIV